MVLKDVINANAGDFIGACFDVFSFVFVNEILNRFFLLLSKTICCGLFANILQGTPNGLNHGGMVSWLHGVMVGWLIGIMVDWLHGVMVSWWHGFSSVG